MMENERDKVIKLKVESRLDNIFLVGLAVRGICSQNLNAKGASRMEVCVVEAVTNAIKHSYHLQPGHDVDIVITLSSGKMEFLVCNTGEPMKTTQTAQIRLDPVDKRRLPKGGLGLYLIHRLMDEVTYESRDGVNIFRMCKHYKQKVPLK